MFDTKCNHPVNLLKFDGLENEQDMRHPNSSGLGLSPFPTGFAATSRPNASQSLLESLPQVVSTSRGMIRLRFSMLASVNTPNRGRLMLINAR